MIHKYYFKGGFTQEINSKHSKKIEIMKTVIIIDKLPDIRNYGCEPGNGHGLTLKYI